MRFLYWIRILFEDYKFARRFTLFWAIGLITFSVIQFFLRLPEFKESPQGMAFVAIMGVLAAVIGFYQVHRSRDGD